MPGAYQVLVAKSTLLHCKGVAAKMTCLCLFHHKSVAKFRNSLLRIKCVLRNFCFWFSQAQTFDKDVQRFT